MRSRRNALCLASAGAITILAITMAVAADNATPKLRYGVKKDQQYSYDVKIEAELEDYNETREGCLIFTVLSADENQFAVHCTGMLHSQRKPKPGSNVILFPGFSPPSMGIPRMSFGGREELTFNRQGEVIVSRDLTFLPYLLGHQELLVFEQFPAEAKSTWESQQDVVILEAQSTGPFPRFAFRGNDDANATKRTSKKRTTYTVVETKPDAVRISKKYDLRTAEQTGGGARFEMTGAGEFVFDPKEGVIRSLSMKYNVVSRDGGHMEQFPVTLTYKMPTPEELAERKKKADEFRAAQAEAKRPKPFAAGEKAQLLADLQSSDKDKQRAAAERLGKAPVDDQPAEVAKALAPLLAGSEFMVQQAAAEALLVWATPEVEAELCRAAASDNHFVNGSAMKALAKIPSAKAAQVIAAQMFRDRHAAAAALKAMGPIAETAAIGCLKDRDVWVRRDICAVLGEIGGQAAFAALQEQLRGATDHFEKKSAEDALDAIRSRLAVAGTPVAAGSPSPVAPESPSPAAPSATGLPGFRTWRDASGLFEIDAVMIGSENGKVTLVKKDGKTISVPLDKLSDADREYVLKHSN